MSIVNASNPSSHSRLRGAATVELQTMIDAAEQAARFGRYTINLATWTVTWSAGVAAIFGRAMPPGGTMSLDDHIGCYHADDAAACRVALAAAMAGAYSGGPYTSQGRVLRPDGSIRHVIAQGTGFADERGFLTATSGILLDNTEAVEADCIAREHAETLQVTLEAMDQGILMVGPDRRIRVANTGAKRLLDLPDAVAAPGTLFADLLAYQEHKGEFAHLADADRPCLSIWSNAACARLYTRERPNGIVLEVRTAPLADGGFVRTFTDVTLRHQHEQALAISEEKYRLLAENTTDTIIWSDLDMRRRYVSPSVRTLLGYKPEELLGLLPTQNVHEDDVAGYAADIAELIGSETGKMQTRRRYRRNNGTFVWVDITSGPIREPATGVVKGYVTALRDASAQVAAEDALRLSEQRLAFALDSGGDGIWSYDCEQDHVTLAGRWWAILGYREDEIEATFVGWHALTHADDQGRVNKAMVDHLEGRTAAIEIEYRVRAKHGGYVWTLARGKVANRAGDGRPKLLIGTHMDITRRKAAELAVAHMATHDALTGLTNRTPFLERLDQQISSVARQGNGFAVLACDLDHFKSINDTFGHAAGDELLIAVAQRLSSVVRAEDVVARFGGDEFFVLLDHIESQVDAIATAERAIAAVSQPLEVGGQLISVGISVGIAIGLDHGRTASNLCERADLAMYVAKASGRNHHRVYIGEMDALRPSAAQQPSAPAARRTPDHLDGAALSERKQA